MHYRTAIDIIYWCIKNDVDRDRALILADALHRKPSPEVVWELEIPEQYVCWLVLMYNLQVVTDERLSD